jgi:anti-sigma factor RsiW
MATQAFGRAPDEHLDIEVVDDLVEGLLTPEQAASVQTHLDQCPECRDVRNALADIRGVLRPQSLGPQDQTGGEVRTPDTTARPTGPQAETRAATRATGKERVSSSTAPAGMPPKASWRELSRWKLSAVLVITVTLLVLAIALTTGLFGD